MKKAIADGLLQLAEAWAQAAYELGADMLRGDDLRQKATMEHVIAQRAFRRAIDARIKRRKRSKRSRKR